MSTPTLQLLKQAVTIAEQIAALEAEMAAIMGGEPVATRVATAAPVKTPRKKGGISAAGRARIIAAQKARWAKIKNAKPAAVAQAPAPAKKKKRTFSPAVRAKLAAAMKARWAAAKAGKAPAPNA